jgi:uncharacterized membrane protein YcaP (DUF421 family)
MLDTGWAAISRALGLGLEAKDLNVWHTSLRAIIVFIVSIGLIQLGHKRFMGKNTALDVMLGIVFGSVVSRAITGNAAFFPALVGALVLVLLHWLLCAVAFHWHAFGTLVKGEKTLLVQDGKAQYENLRRTHITEHDLEEAMRTHGKEPDLQHVKAAYLERNGDISIIEERD